MFFQSLTQIIIQHLIEEAVAVCRLLRACAKVAQESMHQAEEHRLRQLCDAIERAIQTYLSS